MIPLNDLSRAASADRAALTEILTRVGQSGWFIKGPEVTGFESEFSTYLGVAGVVGVGNGTDALEICLRTLGLGAGSRVATVANAGFYTSTACLAVGATPAYVDVCETNLQMDPTHLREVLARGVDAVVLTHLYGDCSAAPEISQMCRAAGIPLIEDCAQAAGARYEGRAAGSYGTIAAFSFYPTKNLGALGDGGAVVSVDEDLVTRAREISQYGWSQRYLVSRPGRNSRLDEVQAAVLRHRLTQLDDLNEIRQGIIREYSHWVQGSGWRMAFHDKGSEHVAHLAVVAGADVGPARQNLRESGVQTDIHYPIPDHMQPCWGDAGSWPPLPVTERMASRIFSVPCFPEMTDQEVRTVGEALARAAANQTAGGAHE